MDADVVCGDQRGVACAGEVAAHLCGVGAVRAAFVFTCPAVGDVLGETRVHCTGIDVVGIDQCVARAGGRCTFEVGVARFDVEGVLNIGVFFTVFADVSFGAVAVEGLDTRHLVDGGAGAGVAALQWVAHVTRAAGLGGGDAVEVAPHAQIDVAAANRAADVVEVFGGAQGDVRCFVAADDTAIVVDVARTHVHGVEGGDRTAVVGDVACDL